MTLSTAACFTAVGSAERGGIVGSSATQAAVPVAEGVTSQLPGNFVDLHGTVLTAEGKPAAGIMVFVVTAEYQGNAPSDSLMQLARARQGQVLRTDGSGHFVLPHLDDRLRVAVKLLPPPSLGAVSEVETLQFRWSNRLRLPAAAARPARSISGTVVNEDGRPIEGAIVHVYSTATGLDHRELSYDSSKAVDSDAVTGADGTFILPARKDDFIAKLVITVPGIGEAIVPEAAPGKPVSVKLEPGVMLRGKVVDQKTGGPAPFVPVMMELKPIGTLGLRERYTTTDAKGAYLFDGLKAATTRQVSLLTSELGSSAVLEVALPAGAATVDAQDLVRTPGRRLRGRLVPTDGMPLPSMTRLRLQTGFASHDLLIRETDDLGQFEFTGLPAERPIALALWASDGLALDPNQPSYLPVDDALFGLVPSDDRIVDVPVTHTPKVIAPATRAISGASSRLANSALIRKIKALTTQPLR